MSNDTKVAAECSFCGKPNLEVNHLVAGPGVYICDECIDLCHRVIAEAAAPQPDVKERPAPSPERLAKMVEGLRTAAERMERNLRRSVIQYREWGASWEQIADQLDVTAEEAAARFG